MRLLLDHIPSVIKLCNSSPIHQWACALSSTIFYFLEYLSVYVFHSSTVSKTPSFDLLSNQLIRCIILSIAFPELIFCFFVVVYVSQPYNATPQAYIRFLWASSQCLFSYFFDVSNFFFFRKVSFSWPILLLISCYFPLILLSLLIRIFFFFFLFFYRKVCRRHKQNKENPKHTAEQ